MALLVGRGRRAKYPPSSPRIAREDGRKRPLKRGPIHRAFSRGHGVWVPALKGVYARLRGLCAGTTADTWLADLFLPKVPSRRCGAAVLPVLDQIIDHGRIG